MLTFTRIKPNPISKREWHHYIPPFSVYSYFTSIKFYPIILGSKIKPIRTSQQRTNAYWKNIIITNKPSNQQSRLIHLYREVFLPVTMPLSRTQNVVLMNTLYTMTSPKVPRWNLAASKVVQLPLYCNVQPKMLEGVEPKPAAVR